MTVVAWVERGNGKEFREMKGGAFSTEPIPLVQAGLDSIPDQISGGRSPQLPIFADGEHSDAKLQVFPAISHSKSDPVASKARRGEVNSREKLAYQRLFRDWLVRGYDLRQRKDYARVTGDLVAGAHLHGEFLENQLIGEPRLAAVLSANPVLNEFARTHDCPPAERNYSNPESKKWAGVLKAYRASH